MERRKKVPQVLVLGPRAEFDPLFTALELEERFRLRFAESLRDADADEGPRPDVIVLLAGAQGRAAPDALQWIEKLKAVAPVILMSSAADMNFYMAAMTQGAFDYFTAYTPLEEVQRVLSSAAYWASRQAA